MDVISLGQVSFIVIIQTIIVLVLLSAVLFFLLRAKNKELRKLKHSSTEHNDDSPAASIEHYLATEIKLTQSRYDLFYKEENIQDGILSEPDWLLLRRSILDMEKDLLASKEREDPFWVGLGEKLKRILNQRHLVKRLKLKEVEEDEDEEAKEMKALLKSQYDTFDELYLKLEGAKSEADITELKEKLNTIIRSHTELSHCIFILEDENLFLRNQIKSLLDVSATQH